MNRAARPSRTATGRPLLALAGLVTCWIGARVAVWEAPEPPPVFDRATTRLIELTSISGSPAAARDMVRNDAAEPRPADAALARVVLAKVEVRARSDGDTLSTSRMAAPALVRPYPTDARGPVLALVEPPQAATAPATDGVPAAGPSRQQRPLPTVRWSADLWMALRQGGRGLFGSGASVPVYGASQAGAVLRYRLMPASPHDPAIYARAVQALHRREGDLAAGFAARVVPDSPVIAHVEARASRRGERVDLRPAAFLTTGFEREPLAFGLHARGYGQAGYVGGHDATGFADGNVVAEREMMRVGDIAFAAGAGVWGGAQRGSARLDIGPSTTLRFPLSGGTGRLTLEYRLRVAGNAEPPSGAALTLSAGF